MCVVTRTLVIRHFCAALVNVVVPVVKVSRMTTELIVVSDPKQDSKNDGSHLSMSSPLKMQWSIKSWTVAEKNVHHFLRWTMAAVFVFVVTERPVIHAAVVRGSMLVSNVGFFPSFLDRLTLQLTEYIESSIVVSTDFNDLDCQAIFTGPVQVYSSDRCQCKVNAFVNYANDGCCEYRRRKDVTCHRWFRLIGHRLDTVISDQREPEYCPPRSAFENDFKCVCDVGYETQDRTCGQFLASIRASFSFTCDPFPALFMLLVPKADRVYAENDTIAMTNPRLIVGDCVKLFGTGSRLSAVGNYCICIPQAFPVNAFTYCRE